MKKSIIVLLHTGFWGCYTILIIIILGAHYHNSDPSTLHMRIENALKNLFLFAVVPSLLSFYTYYLLLFPRYLQKKRFIGSVIYGLLISTLAALIGYALLRYCINTGLCIDMDQKGDSSPHEVIIFMAFIASISGIVALTIKGFITWYEEIKVQEELRQKNHETEMALIKAQLDPHFLFNTLNNIDVLILRNASMASEYLNKLSDILRFMLYETKIDKIALSKEIEYIEKYIELQKIRTSNPNYVHFDVSGSTAQKSIAPLIFVPFIENAFKHTNNKKKDHAIKIQIDISDKSLIFVCENKYSTPSSKDQSANGLGNELIHKRLQLLYPNTHLLEITHSDELYRVKLTIDHAQI